MARRYAERVAGVFFFLLKAAPNSYDQGMALHRTKTTQQQRQWILGGLVRGLRAAVSR
jgi:hypothetical protein